jgi:hypothetical protein
MVVFFAVTVWTLALAQDVPVILDADLEGSLDGLGKALSAEGGTMASIGGLVALAIQFLKTGWGFGLLARVPSSIRFWIPFVIGAIAGTMKGLQSGSPLKSALYGAIITGASAVLARKTFETHGGEKVLPPVIKQ